MPRPSSESKPGIGHNGAPADDTPIHRIRGGQLMIARGSVHGITAITWTVMCEVAHKSQGDRYWMTRRKTAEKVAALRGKAVDPSSIHRAWQRLARLGLISKAGKHSDTGATVWQLHYELALSAYSELRRVIDDDDYCNRGLHS
jgi:hypothetical protein